MMRARAGRKVPGWAVLAVLAAGFSGVRTESAAAQAAPPVATGQTPPGFAELVEQVSASVVHVRVTGTPQAGPPPARPPGLSPQELDRFWRERRQVPPAWPPRRTGGTGFIIGKGGLIVTSSHVVDGAREVLVTLANKAQHQGTVIGRDARSDLALVRIQAQADLPAAALGDSDALRLGDWVLAIGNPFGLGATVIAGIVGAKGPNTGAGPYEDLIQTSIPLRNAGGPLFNMHGDVVGITTFAGSDTRGLALPINRAKRLLAQLESQGEVARGWLGVAIQAITPELARTLPDPKGVLVTSVLENGPGAQAGIQGGDVVAGFNDRDVVGVRELQGLVADTVPGAVVPVLVRRAGVEHVLQVKVGSMPARPE